MLNLKTTATLLAAATLSATASANLLTNPGFEDELGFDFSNIDNWNGFFGAPPDTFLEAFNTTGATPFAGVRALELTIEGAGTSNGNNSFTGHVQRVSTGVTAGTEYTLGVYARNNGSSLDGVTEWRVEWLDAGGTEVSREQIEISGSLTSTYELYSFNSIAPAGATQAAVVLAVATGDDTGSVLNHSVLFDNSSFVAVPEPATAALLGMGGLAMLRRRK